jgi:deoxyribose-phosphate aldolase
MQTAKPSRKQIVALLKKAEGNIAIPPVELNWLARLIDHTLLKPGTTEAQIGSLCAEAKQFGFATVCVYPKFVSLCRTLLKGSPVKAIAVVGFPTGLETTKEKVAETKQAVAAGAEEIDMVINIEKLQARKLRSVYRDIRQVVLAARPSPVKVILETCLLADEEKIMGCALAKAAGAAFVKTSTGFSSSGATANDVALLRAAVGPKTGVKASGGIRTLPDALKMVLAGANRIGASAGASIVSGKSSQDSKTVLY